MAPDGPQPPLLHTGASINVVTLEMGEGVCKMDFWNGFQDVTRVTSALWLMLIVEGYNNSNLGF